MQQEIEKRKAADLRKGIGMEKRYFTIDGNTAKQALAEELELFFNTSPQAEHLV